MTILTIPGLGTFDYEWSTAEHPTPDPGADPWLIQLETVWWVCEADHSIGVEVNSHALWHKLEDGRTLYEVLEFNVYETEIYEPDDYYDEE